MNGANIMNFTLRRIPPVIDDTLTAAGITTADVDYFILHQSNRFIMRHLAKKCSVDPEKLPLTLEDYGNTGGPSVPLTITQGKLTRRPDRALTLLLVAYGVGLSWAIRPGSIATGHSIESCGPRIPASATRRRTATSPFIYRSEFSTNSTQPMTNEQEALRWIAGIFEESPAARSRRKPSREDIPLGIRWACLLLMAAMDEEFDIVMSDDDIKSMQKVDDILAVLRKHGKLEGSP